MVHVCIGVLGEKWLVDWLHDKPFRTLMIPDDCGAVFRCCCCPCGDRGQAKGRVGGEGDRQTLRPNPQPGLGMSEAQRRQWQQATELHTARIEPRRVSRALSKRCDTCNVLKTLSSNLQSYSDRRGRARSQENNLEQHPQDHDMVVRHI